jgi:hypothetical protein
MTEAKKNWAESRQLRVGAMLPTAQRRPDLRITGEYQSGASLGGNSILKLIPANTRRGERRAERGYHVLYGVCDSKGLC